MLIHEETRKVVLNLSNPQRICVAIPTAKQFEYQGAQLVAIPHKLDEVRVLRNLGIRAPSPVLHYYSWPGRFSPFFAQRETAEFLTLHPRAFVLNDLGCVDSETEYLSPTGWVRMDQYAGGQVAQYHPDTGTVEFVEPTEYVKLPCPSMVKIKTKYGLDQMLSPEHRVLLAERGGDRQEVVQAAELYERHQDWLNHDERKAVGRIGFGKAAIPVTFAAPGGDGLDLSDADLRVLVAVIADGTFANNTRTCQIRLLKDRKKVRLRALLDAAGITYRETPCKPAGFSRFSFYAPVRVKEFTPEFWSATRHQLQVIADEVMRWDGSVSATKPTQRFSTAVKASADFVQFAFAGTGRTARVLEQRRTRRGREEVEYVVQVRADGKPLMMASLGAAGRQATISGVPSTDGFKYCFMVPSTFLLFRRNGCVFASGNTGKTLAALWAFDYLKSLGLASKLLVVSPLSTLERTWADEVFKHFTHLSCAVLHGTKERRQKLLADDFDVYVINHDGMKTVLQELIEKVEIDTVVVDELASFRNARTDRWKTLSKVIKGRARVWGMTGTPTPNGPPDAWAQCRLICPERVPTAFKKWQDMVMKQLGPFKFVPREGSTELVRQAMQPAIRFSREDCVDLPECQYTSRPAPLTPEQARAYKDMKTKLALESGDQQVLALNEAVKRGKLLQIACGVVYDTLGGEVLLPCKPRVDVVTEVIDEAPSKVIVFVPFKAALNYVADELRAYFHQEETDAIAAGYVGHVAKISGEVSKSQRDRVFSEFQDCKDGPRIIVAQPAAMSHGLTLTAASTIIWYGVPPSLEVYLQANGRVTRPGQKLQQLIVHIDSTPVERLAYERLQANETLQGLLLDAVKEEN